jgi:hypothetical protein
MPPIRFRIRTFMIAIALLALMMGALSTLRYPFFENMIAFTAALVFLVAAAVSALALVVVSVVRFVVDLFAYALDFCLGRIRLRQFSGTKERPFQSRSASTAEPG